MIVDYPSISSSACCLNFLLAAVSGSHPRLHLRYCASSSFQIHHNSGRLCRPCKVYMPDLVDNQTRLILKSILMLCPTLQYLSTRFHCVRAPQWLLGKKRGKYFCIYSSELKLCRYSRESKIPWPWNPLAGHLPEATSAYGLKSPALRRPIPSASQSQPTHVQVAEEVPKQVTSCDSRVFFQDPVGIETPLEEQSMNGDVQMKVDVAWDETGSFSSQPSPPALTATSHLGLLHREPVAPMRSDPTAAAALTFPAFSIRDPIAHFQPRQQFTRRTRDELVKRNNKAQVVKVQIPVKKFQLMCEHPTVLGLKVMMNGPPTRNIVTEELQHRIVTNNQGRFEAIPNIPTINFEQECSLHQEPEGQCTAGAG